MKFKLLISQSFKMSYIEEGTFIWKYLEPTYSNNKLYGSIVFQDSGSCNLHIDFFTADKLDKDVDDNQEIKSQ